MPEFSRQLDKRRKNQIKRCIQNLTLMDQGKLSFSEKRILVIDDEYFNCDAIMSMIHVLCPDLVGRVDYALSGEIALGKVIDSI